MISRLAILRLGRSRLLEALGEEDAVLVIDEFPFLIDEDESLPFRIQRVWDTERQDTGMTLVLVGFLWLYRSYVQE